MRRSQNLNCLYLGHFSTNNQTVQCSGIGSQMALSHESKKIDFDRLTLQFWQNCHININWHISGSIYKILIVGAHYPYVPYVCTARTYERQNTPISYEFTKRVMGPGDPYRLRPYVRPYRTGVMGTDYKMRFKLLGTVS